MYRFSNPIILYAAIFFIALTHQSCKSKLEKKDKTLKEMQEQDGGVYEPILATADTVILFKTADTTRLHLNIFLPEHHIPDTITPCIVFFFGGGFIHGSPKQFEQQCIYLAEKGIIAICADYRVISRSKLTAVESVMDAKSAMRWIRKNGSGIMIDTSKIIMAGGSAGGALVLTAALDNPAVNDTADDLSVSCVPDYMVLFNPVVNLEEFEFRIRKFDGLAAELNPFTHVQPQMPPALVMHGTDDDLAGYFYAVEWTKAMQKSGNEVELVSYEGQEHGFYQRNKSNGFYYDATLRETENWLRKHGLLQ